MGPLTHMSPVCSPTWAGDQGSRPHYEEERRVLVLQILKGAWGWGERLLPKHLDPRREGGSRAGEPDPGWVVRPTGRSDLLLGDALHTPRVESGTLKCHSLPMPVLGLLSRKAWLSLLGNVPPERRCPGECMMGVLLFWAMVGGAPAPGRVFALRASLLLTEGHVLALASWPPDVRTS